MSIITNVLDTDVLKGGKNKINDNFDNLNTDKIEIEGTIIKDDVDVLADTIIMKDKSDTNKTKEIIIKDLIDLTCNTCNTPVPPTGFEGGLIIDYNVNKTYTKGFTGIALDDLGNTYVVGRGYIDGASPYDIYLVKYDNNGVLQYQKSLSSGEHTFIANVIIGKDGNIYVMTIGDTNDNIIIYKFSSDGTLLLNKVLDISANVEFTRDSILLELMGNDEIVIGVKVVGSNAIVIASYNYTTDNLGSILKQCNIYGRDITVIGTEVFIAGSDDSNGGVSYVYRVSDDLISYISTKSFDGIDNDGTDLFLSRYSTSEFIKIDVDFNILHQATVSSARNVIISNTLGYVYIIGNPTSASSTQYIYILNTSDLSGVGKITIDRNVDTLSTQGVGVSLNETFGAIAIHQDVEDGSNDKSSIYLLQLDIFIGSENTTPTGFSYDGTTFTPTTPTLSLVSTTSGPTSRTASLGAFAGTVTDITTTTEEIYNLTLA